MKKHAFLKVLIFIPLLAFLISKTENSDSAAVLTFYGGAQEVGGSCMLLQYQNASVLIDCGTYYVEEVHDEVEHTCKGALELFKKNTTFAFNPSTLNAVLITHAHTDHNGRLKYLHDRGLKAPVYATTITRDLSMVMLTNIIRYDESQRNWIYSQYSASKNDFVTVHWQNCQYAQKITRKASFNGTFCQLKTSMTRKVNPCKHCARITIEPLKPLFKTFNYFDTITITPHIRFTSLPAFHIPGSVSYVVILKKQQKPLKVLFSGDIGNDVQLIYKKPEPFPPVDVIIIEGTYGNKIRQRDYDRQINEFISDVSNALKQNKIVWIPAFALDRTQKVLAILNKAKHEGKIPRNVPIYIPSPTADTITKIYQAYASTAEFSVTDIGRFLRGYIRKLPSFDSLQGPAIYITTSGMMNQTFSYELIPYLLPRSDVFLCFVGFQASYTPGGKILNGARTIEWKDEKNQHRSVPVRLTWKKYDFFSGHADLQDIINLLSNNKNATIFLNHGDSTVLYEMKQKLQEQGFRNVIIAEKEKRYTL